MGDDRNIIITDSIKETVSSEFKKIADYYHNRRGIAVSKQSLEYAADILAAYSNPEKEDFLAHSSGNTYIQPMVAGLAAMLEESAQTDNTVGNRANYHINTGNRALVLCGIFPEYANRRAVGLDYYQKMGISAYSYVASSMREKPNLFHNLAGDFVTIANIMSDFRDSSANADTSVIERLEQASHPDREGTEERLNDNSSNVVDFEKYHRRKQSRGYDPA